MMSIADVLRHVEESSAEEVVARHLKCIRNGRFNTFITVAEDESRRRARMIDSGDLDGRLRGVHIVIKDNISPRGVH